MKKSKLFKQFFALRIHGSNLLSPGAEQWMFIARILVFLIATVEAMSWGYMGGLLGSGNSKYVMGLLTGTIIFLVVWMVDITLMSLDRHKRYYYKKIYELGKKDDEAKDDFLFKLLNLIKENGVQIGIGFRIGMVAISMIVTAPFLNQLVFQNDINKAINREKEKIIANKRDSISQYYTSRNKDIQTQINTLESAKTLEAAGKGPSGIRGIGATVITMENQIKSKWDEIGSNQLICQNTLLDYDNLVRMRDFEILGNRYNVQLPENSTKVRSEVIKPILESDEGKRTNIAIESFLGFLFFALLLLKFFEPDSVKIYLSEALQQAYIPYTNGVYDSFVNPQERSNGRSPMQPFAFQEFMVNIYPKILRENRERFNNDNECLKIDRLEKQIEALSDKKEQIKKNIQEELAVIESSIKDSENLIKEKESKIMYIKNDINQLKINLRKNEEMSDNLISMSNNGYGEDVDVKTLVKLDIAKVKADRNKILGQIATKESEVLVYQKEMNDLMNSKVQNSDSFKDREGLLHEYDEHIEALHKKVLNLFT